MKKKEKLEKNGRVKRQVNEYITKKRNGKKQTNDEGKKIR